MPAPSTSAQKAVLPVILLVTTILFAVSAGAVLSGSASFNAHLTRTSFTAAQAKSVKLIYKFSKPSVSFSYKLTFKQAGKWRARARVTRKGRFTGSKSMTVKKVFSGETVVVGRYRLKLTAGTTTVTLPFRVTEAKTKPSGQAPVVVSLPNITGTATQGHTLTSSKGVWDNSPTSYDYTWQRCDSSGANCSDIPDATGSTYLLAPADLGSTIEVAVTAHNDYGTGSATSAPTGLVGAPPSNSDLPTISGTTTEGETLTADHGSWGNSPTSYDYKWQRCDASGSGCSDIASATDSTYVLQYADAGHRVSVVVTGHNSYGSKDAASSGYPSSGTVQGLAPANSALPTISGTATQGETLTADHGSWDNSPTSYDYKWQRCDSSGANCSDIPDATGSTYLLAPADLGSTIEVAVTAHNDYGTGSATSAPTGLVGAPPSNSDLPTISGTTTEGQTLTVANVSWTNSPTSFTYQWRRCDWAGAYCSDIPGATDGSYLLRYEDTTNTIRVVVTAHNDYGSSAATSGRYPSLGTVQGLAPVNDPQSPPHITGTATGGETLTAQNGDWSNSPELFTYQWFRCDSSGAACQNINTADTNSSGVNQTYVLTPGDVGRTLRVTVTAGNPYGNTSVTTAPTAVVAATIPKNSSLPKVSGTAIQGQTLQASTGEWGYSPTTFSYQWGRCDSSGANCSEILNANSQNYVVNANDLSKTLRVVVTAHNSLGNTSAISIPTAVVAVSFSAGSISSDTSSCAVASRGTVECWGRNTYGQLGDGTTDNASTPVEVRGLTNAVQVSTGDYHTCAVLSNGTVECWGRGRYGELGNGSKLDHSTPVVVSGITTAVQVSAGDEYTCAALSNGAVNCWGVNGNGELGNTSTTDSSTPVTVSGITNATQVSAGNLHACAVLSGGGIDCWGYNGEGQLGGGTSIVSSTPVAVSGVTNAVQVSAGSYYTCAVLSNGNAECWGQGFYGELGTGTKDSSSTPVGVSGISDAVQISAGGDHTCALLSDGTIDCWGRNGAGQLGDRTTIDHLSPVEVDGISNAVEVASGDGFTCARLSGGTIECWGGAAGGALGDGRTSDPGPITSSVLPVPVADVTTATEVSSGGEFSCALLRDGTVECWGSAGGVLGNGSTSGSSIPVEVSGITDAVQVSAGNDHACAVLSDGTVECWGSNDYGQLGNSTPSDSSTPVDVTGISDAVQVSVGWFETCAVLSDGTVECWGANDEGQLGNGTWPLSSDTPVEVSGITDATQVSAGRSKNCAVLSDGTVDCWGGSPYSGSTPSELSGISNAIQISVSDDHSCVVLSGGTIECWGFNTFGQLGDGTTVDSATPVTATIINNALQVSVGGDRTCAVLANGTAKCWGYDDGYLGDLSGITEASGISTSESFDSCAVLSTGRALCWGDNSFGQLGIGAYLPAAPDHVIGF